MKNYLLLYLFSMLLGGVIITQPARAQDKYKPKYLRENDKTLLQLTKYTSDNGWIEFRQDAAAVDPDAFFDRFGTAIGLSKDYQMKPMAGKDEVDVRQIRHQRFQLYYKNIKVQGVEFSLHSRNKRLETAHGRIVENLAMDVSKPISEQQALNFALIDQKLPIDVFKGSELPKGELLIIPIKEEVVSQNYKLCYAFEIRAIGLDRVLNITIEPQRVYIDAITGLVVRRDPLVHNCFGTSHQANPVGLPSSLPVKYESSHARLGDFLSPSTFTPNNPRYFNAQGGIDFETEQVGSRFRLSLQNTSLNTKIANESRSDAYPTYTTLWGIKDNTFNSSPSWGSNVPNATTAHWLTQRVHQYYIAQFNQNGYDGAGKYPQILVDVLENNAGWDLDRTIGFGFAANNKSYVTADVLAHEYTHALTQNTANLEYVFESGAINEAISDIFGTAFERYLFPDPNTGNPTNWNWRIAEDAFTLRNMANPSDFHQPNVYLDGNYIPRTDPCTGGRFGNDFCGVHINSGVMNKWFHTLCTGKGPNGITTAPIAFDEAIQIVYWALRYGYLQRTSNYQDVRDATSSVAYFLYGGCSVQQRQVLASWSAVGLSNGQVCDPACNFTLNPLVASNVGCNQTVMLTTSCNGVAGFNCNDVSYSFSGPNVSANQSSPSLNITAPSSSGSYTYFVFGSKPSCALQGQGVTINLNCSGTPPPPPPPGDCQAFNETCSGNDQEIRYVTLNVATAGNYPLTITYKSGEKPVDALVRVGNATTSVHYNQTTTYTTATSGSVFLNQGANTIGLSSGTGGGYVCFTNICTGTGGGNPPTPNCDFNIAVNSANASCNQQGVQLTASCNGANCDGLSYSWDGGQSGQTASFNAGGSNGSTTYSVTVARSGCSNKTATGTINVSGCGGSNPPVGACQSFGAVCSGNGQEVQYVSLNVATAGSYPLTITYTSHEKAVDAIVRVGSTTTPIHYNQTTYGAYTTATTGSVYLAQGANTIGLSSGSDGGYVCFNNICAGNGSGRVGASEASLEGDALTLQLYPNPNAGQFQARMVTVQGRRYSLEVTNLLGKSLHKREFMGKGGVQTETIELANTPTGIVLVSVQSGGKRVSKTLLIQR